MRTYLERLEQFVIDNVIYDGFGGCRECGMHHEHAEGCIVGDVLKETELRKQGKGRVPRSQYLTDMINS